MINQLIQRAAHRYQVARETVLRQWTPPCGCIPGSRKECESCPSVAVFENLVRETIAQNPTDSLPADRIFPASCPTESRSLPDQEQERLYSTFIQEPLHYDHESDRETIIHTASPPD